MVERIVSLSGIGKTSRLLPFGVDPMWNCKLFMKKIVCKGVLENELTGVK